MFFWNSLGGSEGKVSALPAMHETRVRSLGWEDNLEKEMATHFGMLAWRIPGTEVWWAAVYGVTESRTRLTWLSNNIVKVFGIVNKAEEDIFLELSCFFDDPAELKSVSKLGKIFLPFLLLNPINLMSSHIICLSMSNFWSVSFEISIFLFSPWNSIAAMKLKDACSLGEKLLLTCC